MSGLPVVDGDERKVGYYAGILVCFVPFPPVGTLRTVPQVSLYFAAEAITALQWSRLSDYTGRKPILLCGLLGTMISIILFGLSRSFSALVFRYVRRRPQERFRLTFFT